MAAELQPMNGGKNALIIAGFAILVVTGFWAFGGSAKRHEPKANQQPSPAAVPPTLAPTALPASDVPKQTQKPSTEGQKQTSLYPTSRPYLVAVRRLADARPDLGLTDSEIETIQGLYNKARDARVSFELTRSKITQLSPGANLVEIPAYPTEGAQIADDFMRQVAAGIGGGRAEALRGALTQYFAGDNDQLGKYAQKLLVKKVERAPYRYEVVHEYLQPMGTAAPMSIAVQVNNVASDLSSYAGQDAFFPK